MPLTPSRLAVALALALAGSATQVQAQTLPRRDNVETALLGEVVRDAGRDRHTFLVEPGRPVLASIDGGAVLDFDIHDGPPPDVWSSQGGALLVRQPLQAIGAQTHAVDTRATGRRWLRLASGAATRTTVHVRNRARLPGADPWQVPIQPIESNAARTRPGRRDYVLRLADAPVSYRVGGGPLRLDVWRMHLPRLLPSDATHLRVEADGRVLFDGRLATPVDGERMHVTDGCSEVIDLAGRIRIDVPEGTRDLRVLGERGTWLKVLAPLPGAPAASLAVASDPIREQLLPAADESIESAFARAVRAYPDPLATAFLARYSYLRAVAVHPEGGALLQTRRFRPRMVDRDVRARFESQRPDAGDVPVAPVAFHWFAVGARWRIDTVSSGGPGLLRIAVAHPASAAEVASLRLEQSGGTAVDLQLDPTLVDAMQRATSGADGLLALDPQGAPIVDASAAVLRRTDVASSSVLINAGRAGIWVAVEQRVPAPRRLSDVALLPPLTTAEQMKRALLESPAPRSNNASTPASTRDLDAARRLITSRAARFAGDACVGAVVEARGDASRALDVLDQASDVDPVLARCAALQAFAIAPGSAHVQTAFDAWAARADQGELRTGAYAWTVQTGSRGADRAAWGRLADALAGEGETTAASYAALAAGRSLPVAELVDGTDALPAVSSAGAARLRTDRETEVAYARADAARPAHWLLDPGTHALELRATASMPQWVWLRSGARVSSVLLPAADGDLTSLRDVTSGRAPGLAVRVPIKVDGAASGLVVESESGEILARIEAPVVRATAPASPADATRLQRVELDVAHQCRFERLDPALVIHAPDAPTAPVLDGPAITLGADAPAVEESATPRTATQAALQALRLIERGDIDAAWVATARAYALRERATVAPSPGVFTELNRHVRWQRVQPTMHGGLRERLVADGRSSQPLLAHRERWAGLDDDTAMVLRAGQSWVLEGLRRGQAVRLSLRLYAALSDRVEVRTTRGDVRALQASATVRITDTADARGELHLRVSDGLPGTFVALEVSDATGAALDGRRPVAYHHGPLTVRTTRPTVLRITEWDGVRSDVRTQWVPTPGTTRIDAQRAGGALRITALALEPARARDTREAEVQTTPAVSNVPPTAVPVAAEPGVDPPLAPWPASWPNSGGEDGTWGVQASWQSRTDADDVDDRDERFAELRWRRRWHALDGGLWGRLDVIGRRHDAGFGVLGLQHALQWRQADGPWGASLDAAAWRQTAPAGLDSPAHSVTARAAVDWSRRQDERSRDEWELGLRLRDLSLSGVDRDLARRIDNDVYSRYRDQHPRQIDVGYRLAWRARYDTEWLFDAQAATNDFSTDIDSVGAGLAWRWARDGWTASAGLDVRRFLRDDNRRAPLTRERIDLAIGRMFLSADDGWRLRLATRYDAGTRQVHGGFTVEWFDHDGRGLADFAPSELFLHAVTETDLIEQSGLPGSAP